MQPNAYQTYLNQNGGSQPNALEKLLPAGGSVLGGIAGGLMDPFGGEIAGAALGSSLGQGAENMLSGQDVTKDLGSAALEGGVGQLAGLGIGKLGGAILGKVGEAAGNTADTAALKSGFGKVPQATRENLNFGDSVDFAKQNGLDLSPESFTQASQAANGPNGVYNNLINHAINTVRPTLDLGSVGEDVTGVIKRNSILGDPNAQIVTRGKLTAAPNAATDIQAELKTLLDPLATRGNGPLDPEAARQVLQNVGSRVGDYKQIVQNALKQGTDNSMAKAKLNVMSTAYNSLKEQLYPKEVDNLISDIHITPGSPEYRQVLEAAGGNQALADHFVTTLNNAKNAQDILGPMQQLGNMGRLGQEAIRKTANAVGGETEPAAMGAGNVMGAATGSNGLLHFLSSIGHPIMAPVAAVSKLAGNLAPGAIASGANAGAKLFGNHAANSLLPQLISHAPGFEGSTPPGAPVTGESTMNPTMSPQASNGANLGQEMRLAALYAPELLPTLQKAQQAQTAQPLLQNLESSYGTAGGGQGMANGVLAKLSSLIPGTQAFQYEQQKAALAQALSKATGVDANSILASLPSLMASGGGAQSQFGALQGALNAQTSPALLSGINGS